MMQHSSKSISTGAQDVTLDNIIKCLSLALCFGNPTNKTETCIYVGATNSKTPGSIYDRPIRNTKP
jgi:hypothetical protein